MLESLNESRKILDKFEVINTYDERKKKVDSELNKLNARIEKMNNLIDTLHKRTDEESRELYDSFANSMFLLVNSHHTLKVNNGLGNFDDLSFLLSIIKDANSQLDSMISLFRGGVKYE